jgi:hypothetical protein
MSSPSSMVLSTLSSASIGAGGFRRSSMRFRPLANHASISCRQRRHLNTSLKQFYCTCHKLRVLNLLEGPQSYFITFVIAGSLHRRKSAACPKFHMVWLYRLPIPVGRRGGGVISSFFSPCLHTRRGKGGGLGVAPCGHKPHRHYFYII